MVKILFLTESLAKEDLDYCEFKIKIKNWSSQQNNILVKYYINVWENNNFGGKILLHWDLSI